LADPERITALVRGSQAGDERAFADLVRAYQDIAVAYATWVLGDYHHGEDAAQEAFVDAYRNLSTLREPAAFSGWFRRILFKHCDRTMRRKRHLATDLDASYDVPSVDPLPDEQLESKEIHGSVRAAITTLPDAEQAVVLLYYMGQHSVAEVAAFLELTPNTVKTRLYSARQRLRKQLESIEVELSAARPSSDQKFSEKIARMIRPEALKKSEPLVWSAGIGTDVWDLFCACITGDLDAVKRLLEKDPSLARSHHAYRTPIYFAVRENQHAVARYLLEHGADPLGLAVNDSLLDIARDRGYSEMQKLLESHYAAHYGASPRGEAVAQAIRDRDRVRVRSLLDASPDLLHAGDGRSNQPIHWAVMTRQTDMVDELLARGADINARRQDGARPIHLTNGDYHYRGWRDVPPDVTPSPGEVLDHLRARGAYIDIGTAASIGDLGRVRELLDQDPSLANRVSDYVSYYVGSGAPLKNAAARGHIEVVKLLLERGADPNLPEEGIAPNGHALYSAVYSGHYEIAKLLLEHGAYPSPAVESSADALSIAMMNKDQRMIELLCSYGSHRSVELLAHYGDLVTAAAVFAANPSLANNPGALGSTLGNEAFIRLMLHYCPDLPTGISAAGETREITELLFAHGMDPNRRDWLGITALHEFARKGECENAAVFIDHGADIHARDDDICSTPLGWAAKFGKQLMVELLLRRGARLHLPDDPPWATPIAWATNRRHTQVLELLKHYEQTGALPRQPMQRYEAVVADFLEAWRTGDPAAIQRLVDYYQFERKPNADQFRNGIRKRLGKPADGDLELTRADAELLVARLHGYASWSTLVEDVAE
jgi:RNA polymerase sigma factor (sigma-70 family)